MSAQFFFVREHQTRIINFIKIVFKNIFLYKCVSDALCCCHHHLNQFCEIKISFQACQNGGENDE